MRTLYLLRHAKSSWDDPAPRDFDRPLAKRGRKAAPVIGRWMAEHGHRPELVLCSTAKRARETLDLVAGALGDPATEYDDDLYVAGARDILDRVARVDAGVSSVMVIGHNPAMQALAVALGRGGGDGDPDAYARLRGKYPTAALAVFETDAADWAAAGPGDFRLVAFVRPKDLDDGV